MSGDSLGSKRVLISAILLLSILFSWSSITVNADIVTTGVFRLSFANGESFQIQISNSPNRFMTYTVESGTLEGNGTLSSTTMGTGLFTIIPLTNGTLNITYPSTIDFAIDNVRYLSPCSYSFTAGKPFTIAWNMTLEVWLPIMLGFGLCGLAMVTIAPIYFIGKFKGGNLGDAFCWGFLLFIIGIAFIIAWLWS